jgi:hypothetical protein
MKANLSRSLFAALAVPVLAGLVYGLPAAAADEASTSADVEVLPGEVFAWTARVVACRNVLFPGWALGAPDNRGAFFVMNGWLELEMSGVVNGAEVVSIWAASHGWQSSNIRIFVSPDGRQWKLAGVVKVRSSRLARYELAGSFGKVRYIKIDRNGGRWSWLLLDAVGVKGGDAGNQGKDDRKKK